MKDNNEIDCMDLIRHQRDAEKVFKYIENNNYSHTTIKTLTEESYNYITSVLFLSIDSDWLETIVENYMNGADKAEVIYELICLLKSEFNNRDKVDWRTLTYTPDLFSDINRDSWTGLENCKIGGIGITKLKENEIAVQITEGGIITGEDDE